MPSGPLEADNCCLPGDITVTKIPSGYLIGCALDQLGPGPWWEYVGIVRSYDDAVHHAQTLARMHNVRAWLHKSKDDYDPIWPEPTPSV